MHRTAVVDGDGPGRPGQVLKRIKVKRLHIVVAQMTHPVIRFVILIVERTVMTTRHHSQRAICDLRVGEIGADGQHVVVGVGEPSGRECGGGVVLPPLP